MSASGYFYCKSSNKLTKLQNRLLLQTITRLSIMMHTTKLILAVVIAGLTMSCVLSQVLAMSVTDPSLERQSEMPSHSDSPGTNRVYLGMIITGSNQAHETTNNLPASTLRVLANAGTTCENVEQPPVSGARITVISGGHASVLMTDNQGFVQFSGLSEPTVVQIEWPQGLFPCPNSRPSLELPVGTGEVTFNAIAP